MLWLLIALLQPAPPASQPVSLPKMPLKMRIQAQPAPAVMLTEAKQIEALLGKRVTFEGKAANAKLAALVLADGFSVYVIEKSGWADAEVGKTVRITGTLERTDAFKAKVTPSGITQGTGGGDLVVRQATTTVVD